MMTEDSPVSINHVSKGRWTSPMYLASGHRWCWARKRELKGLGLSGAWQWRFFTHSKWRSGQKTRGYYQDWSGSSCRQCFFLTITSSSILPSDWLAAVRSAHYFQLSVSVLFVQILQSHAYKFRSKRETDPNIIFMISNHLADASETRSQICLLTYFHIHSF